jgi:hypothetical protein
LDESIELTPAPADAAVSKGIARSLSGDLRGAVAAFDEAIAVYRRLLERNWRAERARDLAVAVMNKGYALADLCDRPGAVAAFEEVVTLSRRLIELGHPDQAQYLTEAEKNKQCALSERDGVRSVAPQAHPPHTVGLCEFCGTGPVCVVCGRGRHRLTEGGGT